MLSLALPFCFEGNRAKFVEPPGSQLLARLLLHQHQRLDSGWPGRWHSANGNNSRGQERYQMGTRSVHMDISKVEAAT